MGDAYKKFVNDGWWVLLASAGVLGAAALSDRGGLGNLYGGGGSYDVDDDMGDDGSWNDEGSAARNSRTGRFQRG
jgi:hypothetical protein